ncbi:MAG: MBOAT family protein [Cyanobacteria bacterium SBLK]|nr:MBOAT family protein [Cyanobacteria bacterium SBLK]
MLFNSLTFVVFVIVTFALYYLPPCRRFQVPILVLASFIFYAWSSPILLLLLVLSIVLNVLASYKIVRGQGKTRIPWAILGIAINLMILGTFKYAGLLASFFLNTFGIDPELSNSGTIDVLLTLPLPVGISFYTFQGMSLVIDVLRNPEGTDRDREIQEKYFRQLTPLRYCLNTCFFIAFFPQLVAGPIVRANSFYPQIEPKYFASIPWGIVFRSITVGYFLKMFVADNLKDYTFWITYPYYQSLGTSTNLVLLFGYSMQIFADFAGYSLIAIGIAAGFGYTLPDNFNFPYISRSISEFWRRWHISLSTWLRYYLYIPLGGNRKGKIRTYVNLIVVMTLGGLWHGAAWSYAVWGLFHGIGLAIERLLGLDEKSLKQKTFKHHQQNLTSESNQFIFWKEFIIDLVRVLSVFSFVSFGWLLFKLSRFEQALDFLHALWKNYHIPPTLIYIVPTLIFALPVAIYHLLYFPILYFPTLMRGKRESSDRFPPLMAKLSTPIADLTFGTMLALILLNSGSANEFIYFQF